MLGPKVILTLRRYSESLGPTGSTIKVWSDIAFVTGTLQTLSGNERFMALKKAVINTHKFFMDYRRDITITEKDILVFGARTFEVTGASSDPFNCNRFSVYDLWEIQV